MAVTNNTLLPTVKPFGTNVMADKAIANNIAVVDKTAVEKQKPVKFGKTETKTNIDGFYSATGPAVRGTIGGLDNPDILNKFIGQDLALAGGGPSGVNVIMANFRKQEDWQSTLVAHAN